MKTAALIACLALTGCATQVEGSDEPELEQIEALSFNALSFNALSFNALSANFDANQAMVDNPLDTESYNGAVPDLENQLSDELTQEFIHYVVGCALKPGQYLKYEDRVFGGLYNNYWEGELGLCPDWHKGPADEGCQQLVSSCILSRVNAFGVSVQFSLRGHYWDGSRIPVTAAEMNAFPWREGAFYGDIFDQSALAKDVDIWIDQDGGVHGREGLEVEGAIYQNMFACVSSVWSLPEAYMKDRICAGGSTNCAARNVGACRFHQSFTPTKKCTWHDDPATGAGDEDYQLCRDDHVPSVVWKHALTTFLDSPCALYPNSHEHCQITARNRTYGPNGWDPYDAKGQGQ